MGLYNAHKKIKSRKKRLVLFVYCFKSEFNGKLLNKIKLFLQYYNLLKKKIQGGKFDILRKKGIITIVINIDIH